MGKYKVEISGIDTSDLITLKADEMKKLFIEYKNGDLFARDLLINGNLKLVLSILKKFYNKSENLDDLFQIGCVGLIKAIDNFDLSYDVKFSTYAVPMILGEVKRYIRDNSSIRISRSLKDIAYKSLKIIDDYYAENGKEPTFKYIAELLGVSEFDVSNALIALKDPVSMYEAIYNDGGDTIYLYDQIEDKKSSEDVSNRLAIENAINDLNVREKYILDERFIMGKSQMEIAEMLDISQAQVSRLEKKAINQLKKVLK
ncbi:MAG: SigB/SigF/SigG family RNA polymerase sigma factor [Bacilli bacterium]|nr:SigB/SigF/SigG family RNA polymerase sigma factor [Bacilli bacterium]